MCRIPGATALCNSRFEAGFLLSPSGPLAAGSRLGSQRNKGLKSPALENRVTLGRGAWVAQHGPGVRGLMLPRAWPFLAGGPREGRSEAEPRALYPLALE